MSYSVSDLIDLLRGTTDEQNWLQPLLDDPDSNAVLTMVLEVFARESRAIDRLANQASPSTASGGTPGASTLTLARAAAGTAGVIPAGYPFLDLRGVAVVSQATTPVTAGALTVQVPVQTLRMTEAVNTEADPGFKIDPAASTVMDATAATILIAPAGTGGLLATSFSAVQSATPILRAAADWLAVLGKARGVLRQPNEQTGDFRARVRNIPDAVSPIGVADGVLATAARQNLATATIQEPFDDGASAAAKGDHSLGSFQPVYSDSTSAPTSPAATDFYDDAGLGREMVGLREARAYFRVLVPAPRGPNGLLASLVDPGIVAALLAVSAEADRKRMHAVQFDVYTWEPVVAIGRGTTNSAADTVVYTLLPPASRSWSLRSGWIDHDAGGAVMLPNAAFRHSVKFTFADATTFTTAQSTQSDSERLDDYTANLIAGFPWGKRIVKIEGKLQSNGAVTLNGVGTFFLTLWDD